MSRSGDLVRQARSRAGISQRQLADQSGVAATLISAYENGRRTPGGDALLRLLDACRNPLATLAARPSEALRQAALGLEQVAAVGMALPRRDAGELAYPSFRTFTAAAAQV